MPSPQYRWPPGLREQIFTRDKHQCRIKLEGCTSTATEVDHIIPTTRGGSWFDPANLRAACRNCNLKRRHGATPPTPHQADVSPRW